MTTTPRTPTPQGISALLRKAGFERSNAGQTGVMWNQASTGFRVWKTVRRDDLSRPYVAVKHVDEGQHCCGDCWAAHVAIATEKVQEYAAAIRERGYHPLLRAGQDEPTLMLVVDIIRPGGER